MRLLLLCSRVLAKQAGMVAGVVNGRQEEAESAGGGSEVNCERFQGGRIDASRMYREKNKAQRLKTRAKRKKERDRERRARKRIQPKRELRRTKEKTWRVTTSLGRQVAISKVASMQNIISILSRFGPCTFTPRLLTRSPLLSASV